MLKSTQLYTLPVSLLVGVAITSSAYAGGFSRNGDDIDLLFEKDSVFDVSSTFVYPDNMLTNMKGWNRAGQPVTSGTTSNDPFNDVTIPRASLKIKMGSQVDCLAAYREPFGFDVDYGTDIVGRYKATQFKIASDSYRGVCSYKIPRGTGKNIRLIGGIGMMGSDISYHNKVSAVAVGLPAAAGDSQSTIVGDSRNGRAKTWQAGVAYEIPKIAMRASLMYNSKSDVDVTGTQIVENAAAGGTLRSKNLKGTLTWPESVELKVQSGFKPGWLAFGSVKWENWSRFYDIPLIDSDDPDPTTNVIDTYHSSFKDTWTVSAGVGHKLSARSGVKAFVQWDQGATQGANVVTDALTVGMGTSYALSKNVLFQVGIGATFSKGGSVELDSPLVTYDFDDNTRYAVSSGIQVRF